MEEREEMIRVIREDYGFDVPEVLSVMMEVPRHEFLPRNLSPFAKNLERKPVDESEEIFASEGFRSRRRAGRRYPGRKPVGASWKDAYKDKAIYIGYGQTMSQPYTVAMMTYLATEFSISKLQITNKSPSFTKVTAGRQFPNYKFSNRKKKFRRVLEIGTGSGYQAAILSKLFDQVYTIEIVPQLARHAKTVLARLGYKNVKVKVGSGERGWKEKSPFDAIVITAAVEKEVPKALFDQLKAGGVLVAPIGPRESQTMTRFTKEIKKLRNEEQKNIKTKKQNKGQSKILGTEFKYIREEFQKYVFVPFVEDKGKIT